MTLLTLLKILVIIGIVYMSVRTVKLFGFRRKTKASHSPVSLEGGEKPND